MKKYLVLLLFAIFAISSEMIAQGWLNRSADAYRQRNQQRNVRRNYSQGADQNQRRYSEDRYLREQQRQISQQRIREQQSLKNEEDNNNISLANGNSAGHNDSKSLTLVVDGTGQTKEEATQNALRSAIEQAFGTFVSANTEVLNDELVKDEIATVSSGNISHFNVISTTKNENGLYDVSLQAIVSIGNLTNYTKSKGFQVELAGAEFVMNMKMRELNKKNELAAIEHLQKKLKSIANNGGLFNYELEKSEPILIGGSKYGVKLKLLFHGNDNTKAFYNEIYNTINALTLSQSEVNEYKKVGLKYYVYDKQLIKNPEFHFRNRDGLFYLRNDYDNIIVNEGGYYKSFSWLMPDLIEEALNFVICDNLGNQFFCSSDNIVKKGTSLFSYRKEMNINDIVHYINPVDRVGRIETPLVDYSEKRDKKLHFNPFIEEDNDYNDPFYQKKQKEEIMKRKQYNCYYQTEFLVLYSEDELYQLKNISVKYYDRNLVNSVSTEIVQEEKSQKQTMNPANDNNAIHSNIEHRAEFPGGSSAMSQYISSCLRYPVVAEENGIQGNVVIKFYVETDGSITDPTVSKSVDPSLDKEALRVVRNMPPQWKPAIKDGKPVRSRQTVTVPFRLGH